MSLPARLLCSQSFAFLRIVCFFISLPRVCTGVTGTKGGSVRSTCIRNTWEVMGSLVKEIATKPDGLSSVLGTHMVEGENHLENRKH